MTIWTVENKSYATRGKWQFETAATTQTEAKDIAEMWRESKGGHWRIRKFVYAGAACRFCKGQASPSAIAKNITS